MNKATRALQGMWWSLTHPMKALMAVEHAKYGSKASGYLQNWQPTQKGVEGDGAADDNPLKIHFNNNMTGNGLWKFIHYFDIYHRHFQKFVGKEVHVVEVGIYSGGSLKMWQKYFGDKCKIYGIDIEPDCKKYESDNIKVFIGDQSDRNFWKSFREQVPHVDILIDDGGHLASQQIVTLEEMLPHVAPGGVFLCEDVVGNRHKFTSYINGLMHEMNDRNEIATAEINFKSTPFQQQVNSIHQYPFVTVLEKQEKLVNQFKAPKHGTVWGPFFEVKGTI